MLWDCSCRVDSLCFRKACSQFQVVFKPFFIDLNGLFLAHVGHERGVSGRKSPMLSSTEGFCELEKPEV